LAPFGSRERFNLTQNLISGRPRYLPEFADMSVLPEAAPGSLTVSTPSC
jgi:hypothetical protein